MIPDIGIWEFLLFSVVALVLINPDDWPKVLRKVGVVYGQIHDYMLQARAYTQQTYHDITQISEDTGPVTPDAQEHSAEPEKVEKQPAEVDDDRENACKSDHEESGAGSKMVDG